MQGLALHCGASSVDRDAVFDAATPEPEGAHFPIPHSLLLIELERNLARNGFEIKEEAHSLTRDGARYFGLLHVEKRAKFSGISEIVDGEKIPVAIAAALTRNAVPCMDEPAPGGAPDFGLVIGLRNTHDKAWAAALVMGARVFVCDNLSFSGEVLVGRKHTRNIERDLPLLIPRAFGQLGAERVKMEERIKAYKNAKISDQHASDLIVRSLVDEKIFPPSNLPAIVKEWRSSAHEEFHARTIWSLSNAYTEVAKPGEGKAGNPQVLTRRTQNLYGFFDRELGLSLEAKLSEDLDDVVTSNDAFSRN